MDDYSRAQFLMESARQIRFMITAYSKQMQAQRNYHKKILAAQNLPCDTKPGKDGDSVERTGVHTDQACFVQKLKMIKRLMVKVKLLHRGEPVTLWDFAGISQSEQ